MHKIRGMPIWLNTDTAAVRRSCRDRAVNNAEIPSNMSFTLTNTMIDARWRLRFRKKKGVTRRSRRTGSGVCMIRCRLERTRFPR